MSETTTELIERYVKLDERMPPREILRWLKKDHGKGVHPTWVSKVRRNYLRSLGKDVRPVSRGRVTSVATSLPETPPTHPSTTEVFAAFETLAQVVTLLGGKDAVRRALDLLK